MSAPGSGRVPAPTVTRDAHAVSELTTAECWRLLRAQNLGRLAVDRDDGSPDVIPVNYVVFGEGIVFRSAPGGKLRSIATQPLVAFEVDGVERSARWSVVVRGAAREMTSATEIEASGARALVSSNPTRKQHFIRVVPSTTTGRRFADPSLAIRDVPDRTRRVKPSPVPHFVLPGQPEQWRA